MLAGQLEHCLVNVTDINRVNHVVKKYNNNNNINNNNNNNNFIFIIMTLLLSYSVRLEPLFLLTMAQKEVLSIFTTFYISIVSQYKILALWQNQCPGVFLRRLCGGALYLCCTYHLYEAYFTTITSAFYTHVYMMFFCHSKDVDLRLFITASCWPWVCRDACLCGNSTFIQWLFVKSEQMP